jgi:hypothetical protein
MHANVVRFNIDVAKRLLDDEGGILKLARMKNLKMLGALVVMCGMLGSCGIPMSAVRTAQNTAKSLVSTASNPLGY